MRHHNKARLIEVSINDLDPTKDYILDEKGKLIPKNGLDNNKIVIEENLSNKNQDEKSEESSSIENVQLFKTTKKPVVKKATSKKS